MKYYLALLIGLQISSYAQDSDPTETWLRSLQYEIISTEKGLSQNIATCFLQDRSGFLWIGTREGLNRYDGYKTTVFKSNENDSNSIIFNLINCLLEDHRGLIWIGTEDGLSCLDPKTLKFKSFRKDTNNPKSISHNHITSLYLDRTFGSEHKED